MHSFVSHSPFSQTHVSRSETLTGDNVNNEFINKTLQIFSNMFLKAVEFLPDFYPVCQHGLCAFFQARIALASHGWAEILTILPENRKQIIEFVRK